MKELISVIVPVYNAEEYLNRCVESILKQSYKNFEIILIDDGSSDNSLDICHALAKRDDRIRVIHKENGGASSARNVGLNNANGNWIIFVDSDDWIEDDMLKILHNLAKKYTVPMVVCEMNMIKGKYNFNNIIEEKITVLSRNDLLNRFFRVHGESDTHRVCGMIIRRDILKNYKFIEGMMNEDVETSYYLARICNSAIYINTPLYNYFQNRNGVTNSIFNKKKLDLLYIWDIVKKQVEKYTPEYINLCEMNIKRAHFTLLTQMNINGYNKNDKFMIKIKHELKREVRKNFLDLLKWKMPISRKIMLIVDCIIS